MCQRLFPVNTSAIVICVFVLSISLLIITSTFLFFFYLFNSQFIFQQPELQALKTGSRRQVYPASKNIVK